MDHPLRGSTSSATCASELSRSHSPPWLRLPAKEGSSSSSPLSSSRDENFFKRVAFTSQPNGCKRRTGPSLPPSRVRPMNAGTSGSRVAGELHDEVLPPLFKVHLMGQVLRRDLDSGRLLSLDEDLPELLLATDAAQAAIRSLVGDLRRSPLGPGGLVPTLRLLVQQLETETSARVELSTTDIECTAITQLLVYQIAREALTNAIRHSEATSIKVRVWQDGPSVRLSVEDDGRRVRT